MRYVAFAAAALAVSSSTVSAAVYDYTFDLQAINVPSEFETTFGVGDTGSGSLVVEASPTAINNPVIRDCQVLDYMCDRSTGIYGGVAFMEDTLMIEKVNSASDVFAVFANFEANTVVIGQEFGSYYVGGEENYQTMSFSILDFDVEVTDPLVDTAEVAAVPLPASSLLLLVGLGGMGVWHRRRAA